MIDAGIVDRDIVFVNRDAEPVHGKIVVVSLNGEHTIKRLSICDGQVKLLPENPNYIGLTHFHETSLFQGRVLNEKSRVSTTIA
jgi:DNA polymerase V